MLTIICITILAYWILGKDVKRLLAKVKNVDWRGRFQKMMDKMRPYALKVGRTAARPLVQFYYVMADERTTLLDRVLIYAAILYTISPVSLLPAAVYKLLGVLDEGVAVVYVYRKVKDKITPEIKAKAESKLDEWFGIEYTLIEGR